MHSPNCRAVGPQALINVAATQAVGLGWANARPFGPQERDHHSTSTPGEYQILPPLPITYSVDFKSTRGPESLPVKPDQPELLPRSVALQPCRSKQRPAIRNAFRACHPIRKRQL